MISDASAAFVFDKGTIAAMPSPASRTPPASSHQQATLSAPPLNQPPGLRLPPRDASKLPRVRHYLTRRRNLSSAVLEPLIEAGRLYADHRGNAVILLVAKKANRPIGTELRGTGTRVWRGMTPRTRKDLGYFWVGAKGSKRVVLCESAIDAVSCSTLYPQRACLSTSGARSNPLWLRVILERGYPVDCGFDADPPGDAAARETIGLYPDIQRLRPPAKDWNAVLTLPS